jgi:hypothetical protein
MQRYLVTRGFKEYAMELELSPPGFHPHQPPSLYLILRKKKEDRQTLWWAGPEIIE